MSPLDRAVLASLRSISVDPADEGRVARGAMHFGPELIGPPGRVHGGIHPLVRTLPILDALRDERGPIERIGIDATLLAALPLEEEVSFEARYLASDSGYRLESRFRGTDRLVAVATSPAPGPLLSSEALARWRSLYETALAEESYESRFLGMLYAIRPSMLHLDLGRPDAIGPDAGFRAALDGAGGYGLVALATQLDAAGAAGRGVRMRHPHFTKHLTLELDLSPRVPIEQLLVIADRTTIVEDPDSDRVEIRGERYGSARVEVVAVDRAFERCVGRGFVTAHPVDPSRFQGFEAMRKLREDPGTTAARG